MHDIFNKIKKIHLIGIGGSGMSGIAEVLLNLGYTVSGSDIKNSDVINKLKKLGAKIYIGHKKENVKDVDVVVYSSAIDSNNPEIIESKRRNIPVIPRIEMLAEIARMKYTISVCGTHGKTTTTSMTGALLSYCKYDPTIIVGGKFKNIGSSAKLGKGKFIVVEADESDGSFLKLSPYIIICTNIDNDHLDYYKSMQNLKKAFLKHFNSVPFYGFSIVCGDDKNIRSILPNIQKKFYTYGIGSNNDFIAKNIKLTSEASSFDVYHKDKYIGNIELKVLGIHNVLNALAVASFGIIVGLDFNKIRKALKEFLGVERRLEYKGCVNINGYKVEIYDDYGHHPTEIYYTINALKTKTNKKIIVIFQPHRYSRTKILYKEFKFAFIHAEQVLLLPIYPANEKLIKGVSSKLIYDELRNNNIKVKMYKEERLIEIIKNYKGDCVILTLGAGNVYKIGEDLIKKYE